MMATRTFEVPLRVTVEGEDEELKFVKDELTDALADCVTVDLLNEESENQLVTGAVVLAATVDWEEVKEIVPGRE